MASRNTGKTDTGVLAVRLQQEGKGAAQGITQVPFLEGQVVTDTGDVGEKRHQFIALFVRTGLQHEGDFFLHVGCIAFQGLQDVIREHVCSFPCSWVTVQRDGRPQPFSR